MKNLRKVLGIVAIGAIIMVGLVGCATTVPIDSVRPPTIGDTSNVKKLGIKSFENRSNSNAGSQVATYMSNLAQEKIKGTGKFDIVNPSDPNADGVFSGEIISIDYKDNEVKTPIIDLKTGKKKGDLISWTRTVNMSFSYSIESTRTKMAIGTVSKQGSTTSVSPTQGSLTSVAELAQRIADKQMGSLVADIVPTIVTTNEKLMKETSKDKDCKALMKEADALVKNKNYEDALKKYDDVYSKYQSVAAKTNGDKIRKSVQSSIDAKAQMAELDAQRGSLSDKAIKSAVDTLQNKLAAGSVIMIMKQNNNDSSSLNEILDKLTTNVVQGQKLKVVDRSNQAIISAEQKFQMSGEVDDNSAVSIGKQLGAKYAVLCWVSGTMSSRKLNIKILSIETSQIMDQSNFDI